MNVEHEINLLVEEIRRLGTKSKYCSISDRTDVVMLYIHVCIWHAYHTDVVMLHQPMNLASLIKAGSGNLKTCIYILNVGLYGIPCVPCFEVVLLWSKMFKPLQHRGCRPEILLPLKLIAKLPFFFFLDFQYLLRPSKKKVAPFPSTSLIASEPQNSYTSVLFIIVLFGRNWSGSLKLIQVL